MPDESTTLSNVQARRPIDRVPIDRVPIVAPEHLDLLGGLTNADMQRIIDTFTRRYSTGMEMFRGWSAPIYPPGPATYTQQSLFDKGMPRALKQKLVVVDSWNAIYDLVGRVRYQQVLSLSHWYFEGSRVHSVGSIYRAYWELLELKALRRILTRDEIKAVTRPLSVLGSGRLVNALTYRSYVCR